MSSLSKYVDKVHWIVNEKDSPPQLTFTRTDSNEDGEDVNTTIDEIIEGLCNCSEEKTKKENDEKFEALYKLILKRLPMSCPSSDLTFVKYIEWKWLNQNSYPVYVGSRELCEVQNPEVTHLAVPITNEVISSIYYRINTIISNPSKNKFGIQLSIYDWTWKAVAPSITQSRLLEEILGNFEVILVESEYDSENITEDILENYNYTVITDIESGDTRNISVSDNGDSESYTCKFQGTSSKMFEVSNKYVGLYVKFSSEESPLNSDNSIGFTNIDIGDTYLTNRVFYILSLENVHPPNFSTYLESLKPINDQKCTTITSKEDYDKFFNKSG